VGKINRELKILSLLSEINLDSARRVLDILSISCVIDNAGRYDASGASAVVVPYILRFGGSPEL